MSNSKQQMYDNGIRIYGAKTTGKCPTEEMEQVTFINELRRLYPEYGAVVAHIKNEGKRTKLQAIRDKNAGLTTGACDIFIPCNPPFLCELKRTNYRYKAQPKQIEYMQNAEKIGAFVCIALGYKGALEAIEDYFKIYKK